MPRKVRAAYFAHSLRSDWNNGNAHFLRGLIRELGELGHDVVAFEPRASWSVENLLEEPRGQEALDQFARTYPDLQIELYDIAAISDRQVWQRSLREFDVVVLHEWNPPALAATLLELRDDLGYRLMFHDTHHRASSSPEQIRLLGIDRFDGVVAFGEVLRKIYQNKFGIKRTWLLHEAADVQIFRPIQSVNKRQDVAWVGNWGDEERSKEIREFLLCAAARLPERKFTIYGVRYPDEALRELNWTGVRYGGYLPNLDAPRIYAESQLTVHVPRQQYAREMIGIPTIRVFEALACGIPLISAPWTDTENLFRDGDLAFVSDHEEMRRTILYLLENSDEATAQAKRGRETVLGRHTCAHRAMELSYIFEEVLQ